MTDLPELPDAMLNLRFGYDAHQMREYGRACVAALRSPGTQEGEPSEAEAIVSYCLNYPNATVRDAMSAYRAALAQAQKEQT